MKLASEQHWLSPTDTSCLHLRVTTWCQDKPHTARCRGAPSQARKQSRKTHHYSPLNPARCPTPPRPPAGGSLRSTWELGALLSSFGCSASISSRQGTLRSPLLRALRGAAQKEMDVVRANPLLPDRTTAVGPGPHRRPSPVSAEASVWPGPLAVLPAL